MPCYTRMKTIFLRGLLWLYLLGFGCAVVSVEPGYLDFDNLPDTNFSCVGKVIGGYYADLETNCQMFHVCTIGQLDEPMDIRFLCLNGTVFDQETRVCERIDEVDCSKSEQFYSLNLELYGNTQPSIAEDNAETDPPIIIKASTTTTTTTTTQRPKSKTTKGSFFTTAAPTVTTVTKVISAHHFPISGAPDIRFNPEEINISLNPGSAPNIRPNTVAYQQQVFNNNDNNKKVVVTTHTSYGDPNKEDFVRVVPNTPRPQTSSTQKTKIQSPATPADINYGFTYRQTEDNSQEYTEPPHNFQYHHSPTYSHHQYRNQFKTTTYRTEHLATTRKHPYKEPTTFRTTYVSSVKPTYHYRTEKPQRLQLPLPLLPTLPPLTFSSPAPFSLGHHVETKRYTSDQPPPRIIISASASVSDNSGRRLNYSLGTIGVTPLLEEPPKSYDDYKDHDVVLDPFYHDVPKIKSKRKKREVKPPEVNGDQAAADVLKFLFDWYRNHQKTSTVKVPIDPEDITEINEKLAAIVDAPFVENKGKFNEELDNFKESALFKRKSKFNIVGDILSVTETPVASTQNPTPVTVAKLDSVDYVDDNYEAVANQEMRKNKKEDTTKAVTTEKVEVTTAETTTVPPTTTTTEPTTTSRIMGILRRRAQVHQKRLIAENIKRYEASLNALRPKVRIREKTTTESHRVEETITPFSAPIKKFTTTAKVRSTTTSTAKPMRTRKLSTTTTSATTTTTSTTPVTTTTTSTTTTTTTRAPETTTQILETTTMVLVPTTSPISEEAELLTTESNVDEEKITTTVVPEERTLQASEEPAIETQVATEENEDTYEWDDQLQQESKRGNVQETTTISDVFEDESLLQNQTSALKKESQVVVEELHKNEEEKLKEITKNEDEDLEDAHETTTVLEESEDSEVPENGETTQIEESQIADDVEVEELKHEGNRLSDDENQEKEVSSEEKNERNLEEFSKISNNDNQETDDYSEILTETTTIPVDMEDEIHELSTQKEETQIVDEVEKIQSRSRGRGRIRTQQKDESEKDESLTISTIEDTTQIEETEHFADGVKKMRPRYREKGRHRFRSFGKEGKMSKAVSPTEETLTKISEEPKIEENEEVLETTTLEVKKDEEDEFEDQEAVLSKPEASEFDDETSVTTSPEVTTAVEEEEYEKEDLDDHTTTRAADEEIIHTTVADHEDEEHLESSASSTSTTQRYEETTDGAVYQTVATESSTISESDVSTNLTPVETTTTEIPVTYRGRSGRRKSRPRPPSSYRRPSPRHRFSTSLTTPPTRRRPQIEDEIIGAITSQLTTTESQSREEFHSTSQVPSTTLAEVEEVPATDAPLFKSANPTQAESAKESLHTTPLSMVYKLHVRKEKLKSYIFNCFGKAINKFYSDPRDCRLFHYCTSGYTKNQLLDMKFVCDRGTYFDEEKLICTKTRPERCL